MTDSRSDSVIQLEGIAKKADFEVTFAIWFLFAQTLIVGAYVCWSVAEIVKGDEAAMVVLRIVVSLVLTFGCVMKVQDLQRKIKQAIWDHGRLQRYIARGW